MIYNYDNLPDYLVMLQGFPFDHIDAKVVGAHNFQEKLDTLLETRPTDIQPCFLYCYPINTEDSRRFPMYFPEYNEYLIGEKWKPEQQIEFAAGSQYIIPKHTIRNHPVSFYQHIRDMLQNSKIVTLDNAHRPGRLGARIGFQPDQIHGWLLERLFMYLFVGSPNHEN